jgi:stage V sporulation protein K
MIRTADQALDELEALPGLKSVKPAIRNLVDNVRQGETPPHMIFTGLPGTGKTYVCRALSDIYLSLGKLPRGFVVDIDRRQMIAPYIGQTPMKTLDCCRHALDGILCVDEAYTLDDDEFSGASSYKNSFGREALDTLLKFMDDNHGRIVVILAGGLAMTQLFLARNPAVASRFTATIDFPAYSSQELRDIFIRQSIRHEVSLPNNFESTLMPWIESNISGSHWGNARSIKTLFFRARDAQGQRLGRRADPNEGLEIIDIEAACCDL